MTDTAPLATGSTIGILGGGQLGRMLAMAAARLGLKSHIYCPEENSPAFQVADQYTVGAYDDMEALDLFGKQVDVVTYEFENVPADTAARLEVRAPLRPGSRALQISQDRLDEKNFLNSLGIETAPFARIDTLDDLEKSANNIGLPGVLKTRRMGYDGKGQFMLKTQEDIASAFDQLGAVDCIYEGFIDFDYEISVLAARGADGKIVCYTPGENRHANHILDLTLVPARMGNEALAKAMDIAGQIVEGLDYIGVMGVEIFFTSDEKLIINEIAPRVHNSGHWTTEACVVSQFEQHIRAVAGWPLGNGRRHSDAIMKNLLGDEVDQCTTLAAMPDTGVHIYGKAEAREGRKMAHATRIYPLDQRPDEFK
jgi:5-(carboxyamino)imidazole ribonucleotide synthase